MRPHFLPIGALAVIDEGRRAPTPRREPLLFVIDDMVPPAPPSPALLEYLRAPLDDRRGVVAVGRTPWRPDDLAAGPTRWLHLAGGRWSPR